MCFFRGGAVEKELTEKTERSQNIRSHPEGVTRYKDSVVLLKESLGIRNTDNGISVRSVSSTSPCRSTFMLFLGYPKCP